MQKVHLIPLPQKEGACILPWEQVFSEGADEGC